MAKRQEIEERCLEVQALKESGMKVAEIALVYGVSERTIWNYLKRAQELFRRTARNLEQEEILGETLKTLERIRTQAWRHFLLCPEENAVKVGYLNATLKATEKFIQLCQGVGAIAKVPDRLAIEEGLPFADPEIRRDYLALLKKARSRGVKIPGL
ncbi:MAG: helix-turn-helix domain-containing protein [Syntrophales bacterium]|nr:helix-turn-helix domain-containing protein [Syntrophales bacterium]